MIKKQIYPKTERISSKGEIIITEKLDGSNLCLFKKDGLLYIAQRNNIYSVDEVDKNMCYRGLMSWLEEHSKELLEDLNEGSVLCGEWIGMGKLNYNFDQKFMMFAKANITDDFDLKNINYNHDLFIYPFVNKVIPNYIGVVPIAYQGDNQEYLAKNKLDELYKTYTNWVNRNVEGFVVDYQNKILKYVRMKNGVLTEHQDSVKGEV